MVNIKIKKCSDTAILPTKAHNTDACFDIYADLGSNASISIAPGSKVSIRSGFATAIETGYWAPVFARSGMGCKRGLRPANCVGVIDSDYRGEWLVVLHNDSDTEQIIYHGDRIAQFCILPVIDCVLDEVHDLDETDRGVGGFGSSGI